MIEKILNEISRLKKELDGYSALEALDYIESYINIISREPASDDLEKEIDKEIDNLCDLGCYMEDLAKGNSEGVYPLPDNVVKELRKFARHFAEWQKQKDDKYIGDLQLEAYLKGEQEIIQRMMEDAVEGEYWIGEIHLDTPIIQGYDDGDRIKFVPIKDKQQ